MLAEIRFEGLATVGGPLRSMCCRQLGCGHSSHLLHWGAGSDVKTLLQCAHPNMKRSPAWLKSRPPSPRTASLMRKERAPGARSACRHTKRTVGGRLTLRKCACCATTHGPSMLKARAEQQSNGAHGHLVQRRRVELHELHVGHGRLGTVRNGHAIARRHAWVRGVGVHLRGMCKFHPQHGLCCVPVSACNFDGWGPAWGPGNCPCQ